MGSVQVSALCGAFLTPPPPINMADVKGALFSVHSFWENQFKSRGWAYEPMEVALYDGRANSPCGLTTRSQGPIYCSQDRTLYLDLGFFIEKRSAIGPLNSALLAYVLAHEYGHHVQTLRKVFDKTGELAPKVYGTNNFEDMVPLLEDQGDCLAGLYLRDQVAQGKLSEDDLTDVRKRVARISAAAPETVVTKIGVFFDKIVGNLTGRRLWLEEGIRAQGVEACEPFEFQTL